MPSDFDKLRANERNYPYMAKVKSFGLSRLSEQSFGEHMSVVTSDGNIIFAFRVRDSRDRFLAQYGGSETYVIPK